MKSRILFASVVLCVLGVAVLAQAQTTQIEITFNIAPNISCLCLWMGILGVRPILA